MNAPSVIHPTTFTISGMYFQVVSYASLSNSQAANVTQHFYRSRKFKKRDKGQLFKVITTIDENSSNLF